MLKVKSIAVLLLSTIVFTGCSSSKKEIENLPAQALYEKGNEYFNSGNYGRAVDYLNALDTRYPLTAYAENARLKLIYTYYQNSEYVLALTQAERFLRQHPNSQHLDLVLYMAGLANSELGSHFMLDLFNEDAALRDPLNLKNAQHNLTLLVNNFPRSQYTPDAINRLNYIVNSLARHEYHVARFYAKRDAHVAVINRALGLIDTYPETLATKQVLPLLEQSYKALGLNQAAKSIAPLIEMYNEKSFKDIPVPEKKVKLTLPN